MAFGLPGGRGPNLATEFALPNPGSVSQTNSGPQGGLGPKYLVIPGKRPGLYWYAEDDFVPQAVVVVDDDAWINGPAGQFAPIVSAAVADDELPRLGVDEDYWLISQQTAFVVGKVVVSDEDVLPRLGFDDEPWIPQQSRPFAQAGTITSDDDVFPVTAIFGLDDDYQWSNAASVWTAPLQAVLSDDDVWPTPPTPFGLDEDYWYVNNGILYTVPLQAFLDDDDWPSGIVPDVVVPPIGDGGRSPHRGFDLKAWKKKQKPLRDLEDDIEALYKEITSPPLARQAEKVVKPFVPVKLRDDIKPSNIEWDKVVQSIRAIEKLHALYEQEIRDDDDDIEEFITLL